MIKPEPVTIEGKRGSVVFLDKDWKPVAADADEAVAARVVFDDGTTGVYVVTPKAAPSASRL